VYRVQVSSMGIIANSIIDRPTLEFPKRGFQSLCGCPARYCYNWKRGWSTESHGKSHAGRYVTLITAVCGLLDYRRIQSDRRRLKLPLDLNTVHEI
jgi:hypothetical protein